MLLLVIDKICKAAFLCNDTLFSVYLSLELPVYQEFIESKYWNLHPLGSPPVS